MTPAEATTSPLVRSHRCAAMVVEPISMARPNIASCRPGHTPMICFSRVHRHRDLPGSRAQCALQHLQHGEIAGEILEIPFPLERIEQAPQIARRVVHVGLFDLHVVQSYHGIELDRASVRLFSHHLTMHLAALGHVDDHVGEHTGGAR